MRLHIFIIFFLFAVNLLAQEEEKYDIKIDLSESVNNLFIKSKAVGSRQTIAEVKCVNDQFFIKTVINHQKVNLVTDEHIFTLKSDNNYPKSIIEIGFLGFESSHYFGLDEPVKLPQANEFSVNKLLEIVCRENFTNSNEWIISIPYKFNHGVDALFNIKHPHNSRIFFLIVNKDSVPELPPEIKELDYQQIDVQSGEKEFSELALASLNKDYVSELNRENDRSYLEGYKDVRISPAFYNSNEELVETTPELKYIAYKHLEEQGFWLQDVQIKYKSGDFISIPDKLINKTAELSIGKNEIIENSTYIKDAQFDYSEQENAIKIDFILKRTPQLQSYSFKLKKYLNYNIEENEEDLRITTYTVELWFNNRNINTMTAEGICIIEGLVKDPLIKYDIKIIHPDYKQVYRKADSDLIFNKIQIDQNDLTGNNIALFLLEPETNGCEIIFHQKRMNSNSTYAIEDFSVHINIPFTDFDNGYYIYNPADDPYHPIKEFDKLWTVRNNLEIKIHQNDKTRKIPVIRKIELQKIIVNFDGYIPENKLFYELAAFINTESLTRRKIKGKDIVNGQLAIDINLPLLIKQEDSIALILDKPFGYDIHQEGDWTAWKNDKIKIPVKDLYIDLEIEKLPTFEFFYLDISDIYDLDAVTTLLENRITHNNVEFFIYLSNSNHPVIAQRKNMEEFNELLNMISMLRPEPPLLANETTLISSYINGLIYNENRRSLNYNFLFSGTFMNHSSPSFIKACISTKNKYIQSINIYSTSDMNHSYQKSLKTEYKNIIFINKMKGE